MQRAAATAGVFLALVLIVASPASAQCGPDVFEPNDTCISTQDFLLGSQGRSLDFCDDPEDWITFNACGGKTYTFETFNLGPQADTVIEIYDRDCATLLASDDDGGAGAASHLTWTAPDDGVFHLLVRQDDGLTGLDREYDVSLEGDTSPCSIWSSSIAGPEDERLRYLQQLSDGTIVAAGLNSYETAGQDDLYLVHFDLYGTVLSQRNAGNTLSERSRHLALTADGGYVVAGKRWNTDAPDPTVTEDGLLARFDSTGELMWAKIYGGADSDRLNCVVEISGGNFLAIGETRSSGGGGSKGWILRLDGSGEVLESRSYGNGGDSLDEIIAAPGGGFVAIGSETRGDAWLVSLDENGQVTGHDGYGIESRDELKGRALCRAWDGGYLLGGFLPDGDAKLGFILKTGASGDAEWAVKFEAPGLPYADVVIQSLARTTDGGYLATAEIGLDHLPGVLKLDASGALVWTKYADNSIAYMEPFAAEPIADGRYMYPGITWPRAGIFPFDSSGNVPACVDLGQWDIDVYTHSATGGTLNMKENSFDVSALDAALLVAESTMPGGPDCRDCLDRPYRGMLYVDPDSDGTRVHWIGAGWEFFDVVMGDLNSMLENHGNFYLGMALGRGECLADDSTEDWTLDTRPDPPAGEGNWYLMRPEHRGCPTMGTYDTGSPTQVGSRDEDIQYSEAACP